MTVLGWGSKGSRRKADGTTAPSPPEEETFRGGCTQRLKGRQALQYSHSPASGGSDITDSTLLVQMFFWGKRCRFANFAANREPK